MKVSRFVVGLAAAVVGLWVGGAAQAGDHRNVLPEASRAVDGGRNVQVLVAQGEIKSNINPSYVDVAMGGGLLGALIDAKIQSDRAKKAEIDIQPVRAALSGFDVDALALETTKAAVAKLAWLQPQAVAFGRDTSVLGKSAVLTASTTGQVAFLEYIYDFSPNFSELRVAVNIQFANKAISEGGKPEARLQNHALAYAQSVTSMVALPSASKTGSENAARWSADDGKLIRQALGAAFQDLQVLIPRALELSEADLKAMSAHDKKNVVLGGFVGRVQEEGPGGTLLFNGALARYQTISN